MFNPNPDRPLMHQPGYPGTTPPSGTTPYDNGQRTSRRSLRQWVQLILRRA